MTGTTISTAGLDPRRRKALFRAWHRGMREMDLLLGQFADAKIAAMSDDDLTTFEILIDAVPDRDLLGWFTGEWTVDPAYDTPVWRALVAFHRHDGPIHV